MGEGKKYTTSYHDPSPPSATGTPAGAAVPPVPSIQSSTSTPFAKARWWGRVVRWKEALVRTTGRSRHGSQ